MIGRLNRVLRRWNARLQESHARKAAQIQRRDERLRQVREELLKRGYRDES